MPTEPEAQPSAYEKLNDKQRLFVDAYLRTLNKTKAALQAGYSPESARSIGHENLTKPDIRAAVNERLSALGMGAEEAVKRMSDVASTRLNEYFTIREVQGYEQVPMYLSVLVNKKREEVEFIQEFAGKNGIALAGMEGPTAMGKRLAAAQEELLELELEKLAHGPDAVKLVAGKPVILEQADLDLVAVARAEGEGLITEFKHTKEGIQVKIADPVPALRDLLRIHGKFEKDNEQSAPKITGVAITVRRAAEKGGQDAA